MADHYLLARPILKGGNHPSLDVSKIDGKVVVKPIHPHAPSPEETHDVEQFLKHQIIKVRLVPKELQDSVDKHAMEFRTLTPSDPEHFMCAVYQLPHNFFPVRVVKE